MVLPEEERELARQIAINLGRLSWFVEQFRDTVALADFCEKNRYPKSMLHARSREDQMSYFRWDAWHMIAARDAAMTIGNYVETRTEIQKDAGRAPTILSKQDRQALKRSREMFDAAFPGASGVRTSVAHSARLDRNQHERSRHMYKGTEMGELKIQGGANLIVSGISDSTYDVTHEGGGSLPLNKAGVDALEAATAEYFRGYEPVTDFTRALRIEEMRQRQSPSETD